MKNNKNPPSSWVLEVMQQHIPFDDKSKIHNKNSYVVLLKMIYGKTKR